MTNPYVLFLMEPSSNINSTPVKVFEATDFTCILDNVLICNKSNNENQVEVTLTLIRNEKPYTLLNQMVLKKGESISALKNDCIVFEVGDSLFAFSSFYEDKIDILVSYRKLTELP